MHQSLFGSFSVISFSVEKLSSEFKSITSMSAEFLGFPGNCNGSPAGKIEKNSKNHPQHFDEFFAFLALIGMSYESKKNAYL